MVLQEQMRGEQAAVAGAGRASRRRSVIGAGVVLLIGLGIWALIAINRPDSLSVAEELADDWIVAWSGTDAGAVAALYSEDGVHVPPVEWELATATGREEVLAHAGTYVSGIADVQRTGEVRATDAGGSRFTFPVEFRAGGTQWSAVIVLDLAGAQVARIEFRDLTDIG